MAFVGGGRGKAVKGDWEGDWYNKSKVSHVDLTQVVAQGLLHNRTIKETLQQKQTDIVLQNLV